MVESISDQRLSARCGGSQRRHVLKKLEPGRLGKQVFEVVAELGRVDKATPHETRRVTLRQQCPAIALDGGQQRLPLRFIVYQETEMVMANGETLDRHPTHVQLGARSL